MKQSEFTKQQYISLRKEIEQTKGRIFKILGFSLITVPSFQFLSYTLHVEMLLTLIPILVIVVALLYLSENHSLMRLGKFIKDEIEAKYKNGWETWLQQYHKKTRTGDKFRSYIFYLLFFFYYAFSVYLACSYLKEEVTIEIYIVLLAVYVSIGIWFSIFLIQNTKNSTNV